jgi:hypothetical protein
MEPKAEVERLPATIGEDHHRPVQALPARAVLR